MFPALRTVLSIVRKLPLPHNLTSSFHILSSKPNNLMEVVRAHQLLTPPVYNLVPSCGFKAKGKVKRRCADCYMVRREEVWYVLCKTHPRHKQVQKVKKPKNTWILTHASQSKVREW